MSVAHERSALADRLKLYLVADPDQTTQNLSAVVASSIDGGVTCVQLRAKGRSDRVVLELAGAIRAVCELREVLFLVNDRVDIARAVGADGVHLGVDDLPLSDARDIGGPDFVIGYSPESDEQAGRAGAAGADYLGIGPVFETTSKNDAGRALGPAAFGRRALSGVIPAVGIGGIDAHNCREVIDSGAAGVAVMGAILRHEVPEAAARSIRREVERALEERWTVALSQR